MIVFEEYLKKSRQTSKSLLPSQALYSLNPFNTNKSYKLVSNGEQTL